MVNYTLDQGPNGHYFVRRNSKLIAGFIEKEHAEMFIKLLQNENN